MWHGYFVRELLVGSWIVLFGFHSLVLIPHPALTSSLWIEVKWMWFAWANLLLHWPLHKPSDFSFVEDACHYHVLERRYLGTTTVAQRQFNWRCSVAVGVVACCWVGCFHGVAICILHYLILWTFLVFSWRFLPMELTILVLVVDDKICSRWGAVYNSV